MTVGVLSEPRITQIAQMGYDAPRPFVPGFWVPACAGMTGEGAVVVGGGEAVVVGGGEAKVVAGV